MLKPSDLTKAELLQVVEMLAFGANKYYLDRALGRIEMQRNDAHFERCRKLIDEETYTELLKEHNTLGIKLNNFISSIEKLMQNETKITRNQ